MQCTRGGTRSYTLGAAQSSRTLVPATSVCSVPLKLGRSKPTHHKQASLSQYKHTVSSWAKAPVMVSEQRQLAESSSVRNIRFCARPFTNCALFLTPKHPIYLCFNVLREQQDKASGQAAAQTYDGKGLGSFPPLLRQCILAPSCSKGILVSERHLCTLHLGTHAV